MGKLTYQEIKKIKESTGIDLRNYTRVIDNYGIKHALKKHGNSKTIGKAKRGGTIIEYTKQINIEYIYVEEKRDFKKEVAMKTMYKRKKKNI